MNGPMFSDHLARRGAMRMPCKTASTGFARFFEHGHAARLARCLRLCLVAFDVLPYHVGTVLLVDGAVDITMEDDDWGACQR